MKERILDPECSKVIFTPSLVTEVFISVYSLEVNYWHICSFLVSKILPHVDK